MDQNALRVAAFLAWQAGRQVRKEQKRAEREWRQEDIRQQNEDAYRRQAEYLQSDEYARWYAHYQECQRKTERKARQIVDSPRDFNAIDEYFIERLMALGLAKPVYYANDTFAFFLDDNQWLVWMKKDNQTFVPDMLVRECDYPHMEEINQAIAGWRRGETHYEPPAPPTNAAWLMTCFRDWWRAITA